MEKLINKRELPYALCRSLLGLAIMYRIFLGSLGTPQQRFEMAMMTLFATIFIVLFSVFMPERSDAGKWLLFAMDAAIAGAALRLFGGAGGWAVALLPVLAVTAVFRFSIRESLAATVALAAALFAFSILTGFRGSMYQLGMWAAVAGFCWAAAVQLTRTSEEQKYRMMYLDQERTNSELEERMKEMEKKLQTQTIVDPVTGLKNFRYFRARIDEELSRSRRRNGIFSLALMEIDDLHEFTSVYGEEEKRRAMQKLAGRVKEIFRNTDLVARYSESQILMMLPETDARNSLIPVMRLRKKIESTAFGPDNRFHFGLSFGIACYPQDAQEVGGLLSLTSGALRRSKGKGSGMITLAASMFKKGGG